MANTNIEFYKCNVFSQKSQNPSPQGDHLIGRVHFWMDYNGGTFDLASNIRLAYGGDFKNDPLELDRPEYYHGPINYEALRSAAESYFRSLVGPTGRMIRFNSVLQLTDCTFEMKQPTSFDIHENSPAW